MEFKFKITELTDFYDYFVFDVWGVLHDGSAAYDGVVKALSFLKSRNKKIYFLSNAPRRASKVAAFLGGLGIGDNLYDFILTSGEAAYLELKQNQDDNFKIFGRKYFYIGPKKDIDLLACLEYSMTNDPSQANFAITTGFDGDNSKLEEKLPFIKEAKKYDLPLICVNPDLIIVKQSGLEVICAGLLAREYEKIGGQTHYYGKPFNKVYQMLYDIISKDQQVQISKKKILAIGDGMETDVKGAKDFGIDSALVTGGILCNQLGVKYGQVANKEKLSAICEAYGFFPEFVVPALS
jgi:HAD superfamily hydrolase (TIGR01459 family)